MLILATFATVIASQAVITGAFSLTRQAIQLGLLPRFEIRHTSESMAGQIYMPRVNWFLFTAVVIAVVLFRNSSNLAAAYGVSVTAAMVIDSMMAFFVIWKCWKWPLWRSALLIIPFLLIEQIFFSANVLKLFEGGWVPITIALSLCLIMFTWVRGTKVLAKQTRRNEADLDWLVRKLESKPPHRVPGTAVFLTGDPTAAPTSLMHNLKHNRVLHERNIMLTIKTEDTPRVPRHERVDGGADVGSLHPHHRALRLHGNAERAQDPRALPPQGLQHRHGRYVVLPVSPVLAGVAQVRCRAARGVSSWRSLAALRMRQPTSRFQPIALWKWARRWPCRLPPATQHAGYLRFDVLKDFGGAVLLDQQHVVSFGWAIRLHAWRPCGHSGTAKPIASGFSANRRLIEAAGTWPSMA